MAKAPQSAPAETEKEPTKIKSWLSQTQHGKFIIDQHIAYSAVLGAMRSVDKNGTVVAGNIESPPLTQGELEAAYQIIKMRTQALAEAVGYPPGPAYIFFEGAQEGRDKWKKEDKPEGEMLSAGALRELYLKVNSSLNT